jgi:regulatory protein
MSRARSRPEGENDDRAALRVTALGLLSRREHSVQELHRKLRARGYSPDDIDELLRALRSERLLSDRRFAEEYARQRVERGYGPLRIAAELRERGIDDAGAAEALAALEGQWVERAELQRVKKFGQERPREYRERMRQARFLGQRGFPADLVMGLLGGEDE